MKLLTQRDLIRHFAASWKTFNLSLWDDTDYNNPTSPRGMWAAEYKKKYEKLLLLGPDMSESDILAIVGDSDRYLLTFSCEECDKIVDNVVEMCAPDNHDCSAALVCRDCLGKALKLFDPHSGG